MSISLKTKAVEAVEHVENVHPVQKVEKLRRLGAKLVPNAISTRSGRAGLVLQKNSPQLLFGVGIVAGVATVVTACKATLELEGVLDDIRSDLNDVNAAEAADTLPLGTDARKVRAYIRTKGVMRVGRLYAPSFSLGVMAVASLTGSHHIMNRRNVALTAAYTGMEKAFDEYRERVVDKYGEEADRNLAYGVKERTVVEELETGEVKKKRVKSFGDGRSKYARVFDAVTSSAWQNNSYSNRTFILTQQRWANDMLHSRGHLFLNDVHKLLGLEETTAGQIVGWVLGNGDSHVDFGILDKMHTDERVHEFMFGEEKSVLLDFNVDGPVYKLLDELRTTKD